MVSIGKWNLIYPNLQVQNYSYIGWSSFAYWNHLVNGISYGLAKSDPQAESTELSVNFILPIFDIMEFDACNPLSPHHEDEL